MQEQFRDLSKLITDNHAETIQRLAVIETYQQTDREEVKELKAQCDEHETAIQRGKGIIAFMAFIGALGVWDWFANHIPKLK